MSSHDVITWGRDLPTQLPMDKMVELSLALSKKMEDTSLVVLSFPSATFWVDEELLGWHSSQQQQQQSMKAWPRDLHKQSSSTGVTDDLKNRKNWFMRARREVRLLRHLDGSVRQSQVANVSPAACRHHRPPLEPWPCSWAAVRFAERAEAFVFWWRSFLGPLGRTSAPAGYMTGGQLTEQAEDNG